MSFGLGWLVPLLRCPVCRDALSYAPDGDPAQGLLRHEVAGCDESYPVIDAVPRMLVGPARARLVREHADWFAASEARRAIAARWTPRATADEQGRIVSGFDFEWSRYRRVRTTEISEIFRSYFDVVPNELLSAGLVVLDAGCGAGRWALEVRSRGPRVVAVDLGASIDVARRNAGPDDGVACVQADLADLPIREGAVDWAYSLGVLHHVVRMDRALRLVAEAVRPGGALLLYLYYALDDRGPALRAIFRIVNAIRTLTSRLPRVLLLPLALAVAALVYWPLARLSRLLERLGAFSLADGLPLSFYRDRSFEVMRNDSLDRFGTRLERRFTHAEIVTLLASVGGTHVRVSPSAPKWHAIATLGR